MARLLSIARLPASLLDLIAERRSQGATVLEIRAEIMAAILIHGRGGSAVQPPSRSALYRYVRRLDAARPVALALAVEDMRRDIAALSDQIAEIRSLLSPIISKG